MKKLTILLCSLTLVFGVVGNAAALSFTVSSSGSSVIIDPVITIGNTTLEYDIMLNPGSFDIGVGDTQDMEFFSLTASGTGIGVADIEATLAFSTPAISTTGGGDVGWFTVFGQISGGVLSWDGLPDINTTEEGNIISIDFEDGIALVCGDTATVNAYITYLGEGSVSVPEPETMLMLGFVLLGLVGVSRKRFNQRN